MTTTVRFDPVDRLIVVPAQLWGPRGATVARLALDTGASVSMVNAHRLASMGFRVPVPSDQFTVVTASGTERASMVTIASFDCLGVRRDRFRVLAYNLPKTANIDGLLGLDFLRDHRLAIDFRKGTIRLG